MTKGTRYTKITLATWNVQTMLKPGRTKDITQEISTAKVDVVALQEICCKDKEELIKKTSLFSTVGPKTGQVTMGQVEL